MRRGNTEFPLHILQVEPPLPLIIRFSVTHQIIAPNAESPRRRDVAHGPVDRAVEGGIGLAPWTCLDTGPTAGAMLVAHSHGGAFLDVIGPLLIVVVHDLFTMADGSGRALACAFLTLVTEILEAEIDRFVRYQRKVGGDHCGLKTCAQKGIEHDITNATHLSRPAQSRIGGSTTP